MKYRNLSDSTAEVAWEKFKKTEEDYRADPTNKEKLQKSREAFSDYDKVRWLVYFTNERESQ